MFAKKMFLFAVCVSLIVAGTAFAARVKKDKDVKSGDAASSAGSVNEPVSKADIISELDDPKEWSVYTENTCKLQLQAVPGKFGKALEASYDFGQGGWVAMNMKKSMDFTVVTAFKLYYKGEGATNSIEVKINDADGSSFGYLLKTKSNESAWTLVEVPVSELQYWWGGDKELDLAKITEFHFAISKKEGDEGGTGKVIFDRLQMVK
ncbi:MAG: CIA30 family protein [Elusimicrobiota bacterium]